MNILVISFLALASLSTFPTQAFGTPAAAAGDVSSPKKSVAAAEAALPINDNNLKEIWQEDDREVLIRNERGTKNGGTGAADSQCRYTKGPWTECDAKSNTRSRTLSLKKGEASCVQTRTIQKKCKKACRYDKGAWTECAGGQMSRTDSLKSSSDATCQSTRVVNKNCNQGKSKDKQNKPAKAEKKEKGVRKNRQ